MSEKKKEFMRAMKFTLLCASAGIIQLLCYTLMNELLHWWYWVSYLIALIISVVWNFTLNRKFTFCSANNVPIAMLKVAGFYLVFTPLSTWCIAVLTDTVGWNEYVVLISIMLVNSVAEYLFDRICVFGQSLDTAKTGK